MSRANRRSASVRRLSSNVLSVLSRSRVICGASYCASRVRAGIRRDRPFFLSSAPRFARSRQLRKRQPESRNFAPSSRGFGRKRRTVGSGRRKSRERKLGPSISAGVDPAKISKSDLSEVDRGFAERLLRGKFRSFISVPELTIFSEYR